MSMLKSLKYIFCFLLLVVSCQNKPDQGQNNTINKKNSPDKGVFKSGKVYTTTAKDSFKLALTADTLAFDSLQQPLETDASIFVNPSKEFQSFIGIGAALTDAAAETFYKLNKDQQALFLKAYFDTDQGIGYSLARTIIHSCDFSSESYTYVNDGDKTLTSFNIDHDRQFRIPFTKSVIEAAK